VFLPFSVLIFGDLNLILAVMATRTLYFLVFFTILLGKGANGRFTVPGLKGRKVKRKTGSLTKKWDKVNMTLFNGWI